MKKFWMALAAFALIVATVPSCSDSDDQINQEIGGGGNDPVPQPEEVSFTIAVSDVTSNNFALTVTPSNYTGNYYVAALSGAEEFTGEEIAEMLVEDDLENGVDLGLVDNEYIYTGAASIPSLRDLWIFTAGSNVTVLVFGVSASGEILTDVFTTQVQLLPVAEANFTLTVGETTASTAKVIVSGPSETPFYLGVFETSDLEGIEEDELADLIIYIFGEDLLDDVFSLPAGQTSGSITYQGLSGNTSYTAVLFEVDTDTLSATSQLVSTTFVTPAAEAPTVDFGTVTASNITDTAADITFSPADSSTPYLVNLEYANYVNQFDNDVDLFNADLEFFYDLFAEYIASFGSVYNIFMTIEQLETGVFSDTFGDLDPGTEYCAYAYHMTAEETLTTKIGKCYFKTTGTATSSASQKSLKSKKSLRSMPNNYVESLEDQPVKLGSPVVVNSLPQIEKGAFAKVRR